METFAGDRLPGRGRRSTREMSMDTTQPHVIVVNDDPAQLDLICRLVAREPCQVMPFYRATDALGYLSESAGVDLIITDLHMPGIDGWRFCHILRSSDFPNTNTTPILIVSATLSREDVGTVLDDIGADAFLSMPYTPQDLRDTVHRLLVEKSVPTRPLVMIIAGDEQERDNIAAGFTAQGFQALQAAGTDQALAIFEREHPSVIVVDHDPPDIDASDLIPAFRPDPRVVILATTSGQSPELVIALTQLGADTHLARPFQIEDMIAQVTRVQRGRTMLRVETTLETMTQQALRNARRIQRLNDCFLALGTDHDANIQQLAQTMGELLAADVAIYDHNGLPTPYTLIYRSETSSISRQESEDRARCLGAAQPDELIPVVIRSLQSSEVLPADSTHCQGIQTYIECPILVGEQHVGSLCVGYETDYEPTPEDVHIVQLLTRVIGRQEQLGQRERELVALNRVGRTVTSTLTLDEVLRRLRLEVREVIGAEICSIALIDPATDELVFRQADDPFGEELVGLRLKPKQGIAGLVAHTGQSILVPDALNDPRFYSGVDQTTGFSTREIICAPLKAQDQTIGVIEILNKREGKLTMNDVRLLESVAAQAASALENARLHEATQRELSERIKAERALRESKTRLQTFVDVTPDLIYLKDRDLSYLLVNHAFADFWQRSSDEIIGRTDKDFMPEQMAQTYRNSELQVMSDQRGAVIEEVRGGRTYEIRHTPVVDEAGVTTGVAGLIRDITERKRLQEQLIRKQKEESILTLATGIVHDFNNALVGIVGNIDILRVDLPSDPEIERTLSAMEVSSQRMVDLTGQLLAYAGGGPNRPQQVSLNPIVGTSLEMFQLPPDISLVQALASDLWTVKADPNQIKQVLLSLLTNAQEAMAERGGTLNIETRNVVREVGEGPGDEGPAGEYVAITVRDTGTGMDSQVKRHLFEPFYSTKFLGRGLGLAAAQGIIRDHDGLIEIDSTPGQGTTVRVLLPRFPAAVYTPHTEGNHQADAQVILVVEDEPVVRSMIRRALQVDGFGVVLADDGVQALSLYQERAGQFDAVLLDLGLPGADGKSVLHELRTRAPDLPILVTSGYTLTAAARDIQETEHTQFLQKPFSLEELRDGISQLLSE